MNTNPTTISHTLINIVSYTIFTLLAAMLTSPPPVVLVYAPLDPTGAMYLPADAMTCAALGCHALSIVTATHIQDSTHTEQITLSSPRLMHDQMRCVLEDISVQCIKSGPIYSIDGASVLAQIAADYAHLPLVLHLQSIPDDSILTNDADVDEITDAILELVLPQTTVVVADQTLLTQWQADGLLAEKQNPIHHLLDYGAEWVFCSLPGTQQSVVLHQLYNQDGLQQQWSSSAQPDRIQDTEGLLSTAISAYLASGYSILAACAAAISHTDKAASRAFQAGMGAKIINQSY